VITLTAIAQALAGIILLGIGAFGLILWVDARA
jgi:hypothetical protein